MKSFFKVPLYYTLELVLAVFIGSVAAIVAICYIWVVSGIGLGQKMLDTIASAEEYLEGDK